ncbi:bifunctional adenosylcobinamide kinase/adenosylcobinamide-phosphate guanylyltransferase [Roseinatronobacter bogoriensis]|uniref:Bifunctional adenosylcobalamin biosynthesis protein n=1 Tax=Roseinatronobacter bogoriensis subsp. barguzinensis TaxID=441209 RepID=A0A2K8KD61_9RHOB|nr:MULTISPECIES: bifunctional adenosylcobinamide kinase/adenosylcobinamide-phosphate guanylyltransferase [Rhodobaca]ATX67391.1 bifunctional adenosylcobinamide kinase/adenosylcobinamide-phosphate guanylyltransferase [Rhodobaca barguzinensis]MBB4206965.1 adenosylcobinamide kinase/adenosylcobinamide-phosphate guanylyltransferase [Rhodobaca bogoriensis DSM 18756]TDW41708.1 adenosylcobinamide kinase /adenosylcobinamide-phosphate guanylyltransferase [Rhodobaca barguzinensis]TDY74113.1 adenosylcobinam
MSEIILYIGGARSGKSRLAEARTLQYAQPATYIATAQAWDDEMKARIAAHQAQRAGSAWRTHAEPRDLVGALSATDGSPRLVDCLTLWLTNIMLANQDWQAEARALIEALAAQTAPVVLVSNEVGMGIVPDNRLARDFRDASGRLNQWVANAADEVHFVAAGLSMRMK